MNGPRAASAPELKAQIEAERAGRPFLVFRDGEDQQRIVAIPADAAELWVGRGESADVRLGWDEEVSGLHAQIAVVRGECTLVDDGLSRNGSYVNEARVHGRHHLRDGDAIRFGRTTIVYRRPGDGAPEATAIATDVPAAASVSPAQRKVLVALCRPYKRTAAASPRRRRTSRSAPSCTSASTRSRPTCAPSSRSSASATCRRTRSGWRWSSGRCSPAP
jgi:pSer/pThr/pTyr-binding forkhead associated (FHA) protein